MKNFKGDIMIIDDLPQNLRLLADILTSEGYKARPVQNGKRALDIIIKEKPDVILLDIMMNDIDGFEVCKNIKCNPFIEDIPVIFISALNDVSDKLRAFDSGGVDYIPKPFHAKEVIARIENQLTIQRQKKELLKEIEHRKQTENDLMKSRELIKNILENSEDLILAFESIGNDHQIKDFKCVLINPSAEDFFFDTFKEEYTLCKDFLILKENNYFEKFITTMKNNEKTKEELFIKDHKINEWFEVVISKLENGVSLDMRNITTNKKYEQNLKEQANIDGLTKISNRRYFEEFLKNIWDKSADNKEPLSIIFLDVDYFKKYNDTYGHQAGDECLKKIAHVFKESIKSQSDLVARYGGEEFVILLPNSDVACAIKVAERIQVGVKVLNIPHEVSDASDIVTLSMGIASIIPSANLDPKSLVESSDLKLYEAKNSGRNRYVY